MHVRESALRHVRVIGLFSHRMPELPDVTVYMEHLDRLVRGEILRKVRLASPFVVRSVQPPIQNGEGRRLLEVTRLGKRLVFSFEENLFLVLHLMIAGRLKWRAPGAPIPRKLGLLALDFDAGTVLLTEASPKSENHTLKRALTDPTLFSGIGNAYSDEILHAAKLSPVALTSRLSDAEVARLHDATKKTLLDWTERLRLDAGEKFPEKVTAFRPEMAVHGKHGNPCPACATPVQRIVYADNETNYCPACQTGGKLLADRSLSRLLHGDWPKSLEEMEERKSSRRSEEQ